MLDDATMSTTKLTPAAGAVSPSSQLPSAARPALATRPATEPLDSPSPLLLVCLQDPFEAVGDSSIIVHSQVPTADDDSAHLWQLEAVLEMNAPRVFAGWATRDYFTLDLSVNAAASPAAGAWGGSVRTTSGCGNCRIMVMPDSNNKVRFSLATATHHATEKSMPLPEQFRFLNADIAFELNGPSGLSAGAVAVISNINWARLIAGSSVATTGLAFDSKWRQKLSPTDGESSALGAWSFAVMTQPAYSTLCANHGWAPYIIGAG